MSKRYQAAILTASYNGLLVPNAPTIGTATAGGLSASVTFTAPSNVGGGAITSYTVISSPGGITGMGASSPVTVSGLTSGVSYTFTVVANNVYGGGPASAASNSITAVNPDAFIENLFSTYLYTGNGSTQTITNGINLSGKGGLVWIKWRNTTYGSVDHNLYDTSRGVLNRILSNTTDAQVTQASSLTAFNSDGFSLGGTSGTNGNNANYVSWTFREQPKFFDVVTYTGTGSTRTVAHNLGSVPGCIIIKNLSDTDGWLVYHRSIGATKTLGLNTTGAAVTDGATYFNDTEPTSTVFTVKEGGKANASSNNYVAYLFAHDAGGFGTSGSENVISCGSFTTNGSGQATVSLGYEPQWLLTKGTSSGEDWFINDNMRGFNQTRFVFLNPNYSSAETSLSGNYFVPTATGFTVNGVSGSTTFIYIAIRRGPMAVPTVGTSVYQANTYTGNGTANTTVAGNFGFPVDLLSLSSRSATALDWVNYAHFMIDRLRGQNVTLSTASTNSDVTGWQTYNAFDVQNSIGWGLYGAASSSGYMNNSGGTFIARGFRRAPSFFDEVCYTGTGSARTITHNLGAVPELMIMKRRDTTANWPVYTASTATNEYLFLNSGGLPTTATTVWNNTAPTASVFSVGTSALTNASAGTYVAYLFSSCAGVSKVGSYTGTGALQTINCGFTSGARFVLIKLISSGTSGSGDWYVWDSARGITSGNDPYLLLDSTSAEVTGTNFVDTDTTGFKVTAAGATDINASGDVYLFLAIA